MTITVTREIWTSDGKLSIETATAKEPRLAFVNPEAEMGVAETVARELFASLPEVSAFKKSKSDTMADFRTPKS